MKHPLFGTLRYRARSGEWAGRAKLGFAEWGAAAPGAGRADAEIGVADPSGNGPAPEQEAAFRFLLEHERLIAGAVLAQVWESFQNARELPQRRRKAAVKPAASLEDLHGRFAIAELNITRTAHDGLAHLVFTVDADWQDDVGLVVVYSPHAREAAWTTRAGLVDLVVADEFEGEAGDAAPTPRDQLIDAILRGADADARQLIAAGVDLNALEPDEFPPLWVAADQMELEDVRRLLAFGADPTLVHPADNSTALQHARRVFQQMGFAPGKNRDRLLDDMLALADKSMGTNYDELKRRGSEIISLLEAAECKKTLVGGKR